MKTPNLKRISISSEQELDIWLASHSDQSQSVMLVTHTKPSHRNYVSGEQVREALAAHGWIAGPRYTLNADLLGHVIAKSDAGSGI